MKKTTKEIIAHLKKGELSQTAIAGLGYSFATVRYQYLKLYHPKRYARFLKVHAKNRRNNRLKK